MQKRRLGEKDEKKEFGAPFPGGVTMKSGGGARQGKGDVW